MKMPLREKLLEIIKKYDLKLLLLFGSQANGQIHKESDVDLAFLSEKKLSFKDEILLNTEFCNIFRTNRVDTVDLKKADPLLKHEIAKNYQLLYGTKEDLFEFKALAFKNYINHLPLLELEDFLTEKRQKLFAESIYDQ